MIIFPSIDPVIISFSIFSVNYYSLSYVFGILLGWCLASKIIKIYDIGITSDDISNYITWVIIGMIIGGRLGYILFYDPMKYFANPIDILKTYEGGMSFHGAFIGLTISIYLFSLKYKIRFLSISDISVVVAPIGVMFGRIANFFNAELYGRYTDVPWGVLFPGDVLPRHPSQIYEAFFEGLLLFIIMLYCTFKLSLLEKSGVMTSIFLIFYSIFRISIECFRQPDIQIGFIANILTLGQLLSLPMFIIGVYIFYKSYWNIKNLEY